MNIPLGARDDYRHLNCSYQIPIWVYQFGDKMISYRALPVQAN